MKIIDWFKWHREQTLDELLNSLKGLRYPQDFESKEEQDLAMAVRPLNGLVHAQYVHEGAYIERPIGFSYTLGGIEHAFSLSDTYERVPIREGSVVIPLTIMEKTDFPVNIGKEDSLERRIVHPLGVRIGESVYVLWIYDRLRREPLSLLVDDPNISFLKWAESDFTKMTERVVEPIQSARRRHEFSEFGQKVNEFVRAYALPVALIGICLAPLSVVIPTAMRVNFIDQPEPTRIRGKILPVPQELLENELRGLEPYSCRPVQLVLSGEDRYWLKDDLHEKSLVFYKALRDGGYIPSTHAMQTLRTLNAGRGYELAIGQGQNKKRLDYVIEDGKISFQSGFILAGRGIGEDNPSKSDLVNLFLMDQDGVIDYFITLKPDDHKSCTAVKPYQFIYNAWLQNGYLRQDLHFAQMQKRIARELEKIARNPDPKLLRSVN